MGSPLEQLPDGVITEIFGKTKCAKSLVRCAKLSTKLEPLVLAVRVHTLYLPIIIRQRFEDPVPVPVPSVPPSGNSNSNRGLFQIAWLFIKSPFLVCIKFANKVREFFALIVGFKKPQPPPPPPPFPNLLIIAHRTTLMPVSSFLEVFVACIDAVKQSTFFPKLKPPNCLELVLSFPDSRHVSLIKWRGLYHSLQDYYFILLIRENIHDISHEFVVPEPYQYRGYVSRIYLKLFLRMIRRIKTGNWYSSIQDIAISYTRNDLHAMREELPGHAGDCVEFRGRGRRWMMNVVRIPEKNVKLKGVTLVIFKGDDCAVEDRMIIQHTFEEDSILFEAALRAYDSIHTVF
ncbi:hypothetical protein RDI58_029841 [Solanum bulbocastanum]|uniref:F-box domain-containing protein n=1 Tax=Solanum bulbocastanum TaxID=147425 RepID=A0AAN8SXP6_SOLBU